MRSELSNNNNYIKWCPETELNRRHADFQSGEIRMSFKKIYIYQHVKCCRFATATTPQPSRMPTGDPRGQETPFVVQF